ncbi:PAB dependent poly(A) specific ribonuclease [Trichuris trichiura]|uniref:PAB dependent poly(A) specific ribonuclease n=1 Tax=Trichuris trichiura TaxID=36087 RepID=A0A077ZFE4_TRITR|nr:PAB dependent poly(A) specific ribonuclease [Trichuris trichiura]
MLASQYSNYGCDLQGKLRCGHLLSAQQRILNIFNFNCLPERVDDYFGLCPIGYFGWVTSAYKAVCRRDGLVYCLRRIHACRLINSKALTAVDVWKKSISNPYVVRLKEAFTTKAFGDHCTSLISFFFVAVVLVYDFHPSAETLRFRHLNEEAIDDNLTTVSSSSQSRIPEAILWQYIIAISSALRAIHSAGLYARTVDASKILVVGKSRLLINCCGMFDVLSYEQQEDLCNFGRLIMTLACRSAKLPQPNNLLPDANVHDQKRDGHNAHCRRQILRMLGSGADAHGSEMENGRLFRLLCKLCTVNERPRFTWNGHEVGRNWRSILAETVSRLSLDRHGAHCSTLNGEFEKRDRLRKRLLQLDAGLEEKIMLMSRDQQNVLIVSYQDLHRCLDQAFGQVIREAAIAEADI